jgi:hypothetical protein
MKLNQAGSAFRVEKKIADMIGTASAEQVRRKSAACECESLAVRPA